MSRAKLNSPAAAAAVAVEHVYKPDICKEGNASFAGTFSKQIFFDLFLGPFFFQVWPLIGIQLIIIKKNIRRKKSVDGINRR